MKMPTFISNTSMYRLMHYFLILLVLTSALLSAVGIMPYDWKVILLNAVYLAAVCHYTNLLFARLFKVSPNPESSAITGLILALLYTPFAFLPGLPLLTILAVSAMAVKYIFVRAKRHLFNPAAAAAVIAALAIGEPASWWVGSPALLPMVIAGGAAIAWKIGRLHLAGAFLAAYLAVFWITGGTVLSQILYSPLLFFAFVMLVEPLTEPQGERLRISYGIAVAALLIIYQKFLSVPYILELALLSGNLIARIVSPDPRRILKLIMRRELAENTAGFWFEKPQGMDFQPGQFMYWQLRHAHPDGRGTRRFFTIASSPTEDKVLLASRFYQNPSTFKQRLNALESGNEITATNLDGEFTLPRDPSRPLAFIAGGIGITPFRSMVKYLMDTAQRRDIVLFYSNRQPKEIAFKDLFDSASEKIGLRVVYVNTDTDGFITSDLIKKNLPDWNERTFYISGPQAMVESLEKQISATGVSGKNIKHDYFPGYA